MRFFCESISDSKQNSSPLTIVLWNINTLNVNGPVVRLLTPRSSFKTQGVFLVGFRSAFCAVRNSCPSQSTPTVTLECYTCFTQNRNKTQVNAHVGINVVNYYNSQPYGKNIFMDTGGLNEPLIFTLARKDTNIIFKHFEEHLKVWGFKFRLQSDKNHVVVYSFRRNKNNWQSKYAMKSFHITKLQNITLTAKF